MRQKMNRRGFFVDMFLCGKQLTFVFLLASAARFLSLFDFGESRAWAKVPEPADWRAADGAARQGDAETLGSEELVMRLQSLGIDFYLFATIWWAAFMQDAAGVPEPHPGMRARLGTRGTEFLRGMYVQVMDSPQSMQQELALVSRLLHSFWGRIVLTGQAGALADLDPKQVRAVLSDMANSWLALRRKTHQGLVIFLGMSQMSRPDFAKEGGFPGVPLHVQAIWTETEETESLVKENR